jgi:hypothetical protein
MSIDIEAYKLARSREIETEAREELAKSVASLHERITLLEQSLHAKLEELLRHAKPARPGGMLKG